MKHLPRFWFIFDVESIGLHGEAFAVAAQVFDHESRPLPLKGGWWHSTDRNTARGSNINFEWISKSVPEMKPSMKTSRGLRDHFWAEWELAQKEYPGIMMAAECCWPVEAKFLSECVEDERQLREFRGPYPLHDIASIMLASGLDPLATYPRFDVQYPAHHPLGDVQHSAHCLAMALEKLKAAQSESAYWKLALERASGPSPWVSVKTPPKGEDADERGELFIKTTTGKIMVSGWEAMHHVEWWMSPPRLPASPTPAVETQPPIESTDGPCL